MKTIRVVLSALAITLAGAAVYANSSLAIVLYRDAQDITVDPPQSAACDVVVTTDECALGNNQCIRTFTVVVNGVPTSKQFHISKRIDGGECVKVPMP